VPILNSEITFSLFPHHLPAILLMSIFVIDFNLRGGKSDKKERDRVDIVVASIGGPNLSEAVVLLPRKAGNTRSCG